MRYKTINYLKERVYKKIVKPSDIKINIIKKEIIKH